MRLLGFHSLSVHISVSVCTSDKSETPRLPAFVCLHICQRLHIWQKWDSSTSPVRLFTYLSIVFTSGKRWDPSTSPVRWCTHLWTLLNPAKLKFLDFRTLSVYTFLHVISRIQCRRLLNLNALLGRRIQTWKRRRKREEMGHFLGSPKTSKTEDAGMGLYSAVPWSWYSQTARRRKLWRHLPRMPVWETMDMKPNCLAKTLRNLWPQIRSLKLTPVVGSRRVSNIEPLHAGLRDPIFGVEQKAHF